MKPTIFRIQQAVCSYYYVRQREMLSARRGRDIVRPRQIAMYLARELTPHSYPTIGRYFGRDHTTVMHAITRVEEMLAADWEVDEDIQELRERLTPKEKSVDGAVNKPLQTLPHAAERGKEHCMNGQQELAAA